MLAITGIPNRIVLLFVARKIQLNAQHMQKLESAEMDKTIFPCFISKSNEHGDCLWGLDESVPERFPQTDWKEYLRDLSPYDLVELIEGLTKKED